MNKHCYRLIFNPARGLLLAVAETVSSRSKAGWNGSPGTKQSHTVTITLKPLALSLWSLLGLVMVTPVHAGGIVADPSAPGNQQAVILPSASGVPLVNIQTPSAGGVSRNVYSQFDVNSQGAILNNSSGNTQTQLGGWIQGNPNLAGGTARVILNEVNSSNPSLLNGYVEIAGSRAQLIIANPSGISCDGCGFINATHSTLTTGTPILSNGNLQGYRVGGGNISISGNGLDARQADYTDLIARAVQVNAGIWANTLNVTTGTNQINVDASGNPTSTSVIRPNTTSNPTSTPAFALDIAALGGMYAGKIHLIGTEAGLGVRNAGELGASVGEFTLTNDGQLINTGKISSNLNTAIKATGNISNLGEISASKDVSILAATMDNQGALGANGNVAIEAAHLTNARSIIGNQVNIKADDIENKGADALIAAVDKVAIEVTDTLTNQDNATIYSQGDISISGKEGAYANNVNNLSSMIDAVGDINITTHQLTNIRENVHIHSNTVLDETKTMLPPTWRRIYEGGSKHYSTVSANYAPLETYYVNPNDILETSQVITPDGYVIGRAVIKTHANDSAFFAAGSGYHGGYGYRQRITATEGTRVIYYFSRADNQSNPDQVPGTNGGLWGLENQEHFAGWTEKVPVTFNNAYGTCSTNCVRLVTEPDYSDPMNRFSRFTERYLAPEIGLIENRRQAHHVINDDVLNADAGHAASISSGGAMRINYDTSLTNQYGNIVAGTTLTLAGSPSATTTNEGATLYRRHTYDWVFYTIDGTQGTYTRPSTSEVIGNIGGVISAGQTVYITGKSIQNTDTTAGTASNILEGVEVLGHPELNYPKPTAPTFDHTNSAASDLLSSPLFTINPDSKQQYLIATDPRFTQYKKWLSSDYMLTALSYDPALTQKRLGDGFYEQKLIREQIAQLTGRRFLNGYSTDEIQYQSLMNNGVTYAKKYNLSPGVALTAAQVASLTSDLIWLVKETITLADGSTQEVLVPHVYLKPQTGDLLNSGALIAGNDVMITTDDIENLGGEINAKKRAILVANADIVNLGGTIKSDTVSLLAGNDIINKTLTKTEQFVTRMNNDRYENTSNRAGIEATQSLNLQAGNDLVNTGASLKSGGALALDAGHDVVITSLETEKSNQFSSGKFRNSQTSVEQHASDIQAGSSLNITAGHDVNVVASHLDVDGDMAIAAKNDILLSSAANESKTTLDSEFNKKKANYKTDNITQQSTTLNAGGNISLQAGRDLHVVASQAVAGDAIDMQAGNNVEITSANNESHEEYLNSSKKSGFLSSSKKTTLDTFDSVSAVGSTISGDVVTIRSGTSQAATDGDILVHGSNVVSTDGTALIAKNDVVIESATNTHDETHYSKKSKSGFSASGSSIGYSSSKLTQNQNSTTVTQQSSTVGSVEGDVTIQAGKTYTQTASDILTPQGDISIQAQQVKIEAADNTSTQTTETKYKQTGLSLNFSTPVLTAFQNAQQVIQVASNSTDTRVQALAAANIAQNANNTYDTLKAGQGKTVDGVPNQIATGNTLSDGSPEYRDATAADKMGGFTVSLSAGTSKSSSSTTETVSQVQGSTVQAGGNVSIKATGAGNDSDIIVTGSTIKAGNITSLKASDEIILQAAQNEATTTSKNSSSSTSIGIGFSMGGSRNGLSLELGATQSKGKANGTDVTWTETQITGGNKVSLESGTDTNLIGTQVTGKQVIANVGTSGRGNLTIESLQDTSTYDSKQKTAGFGTSICLPPLCTGASGGSISMSNAKTTSDYASVNEQSGIQAGDNGFQINVNGNTNLKGAVIASNDTAIQHHKNTLNTETLTVSDVQNHLEASSETSGISVGSDMLSGSKYALAKGIGSNLLNNGEESVKDASTTQSAIAIAEIRVGNRTAAEGEILLDSNGNVVSRDTDNVNHPLAKADLEALQKQAQQQQAEKVLLANTITAFTDESFRKMFVNDAKMYHKTTSADGKTQWVELSEDEKLNLQAGSDNKIHIFNNGIFNPLENAKSLAEQNNNADYLVYFPEANNFISELMIAGYQKFLEGTTLGLTNATRTNVQIMNQYGEKGLQVDGHSRGGMTTGNALETIAQQANASGVLRHTNISLFGSAYNAEQAQKLLGALSNGNGGVTSQVHIDDLVGTLVGGNEATGGVTPPGSNLLKEWVKIFYGESTAHNNYGKGKGDGSGYWDDSRDGKATTNVISLPK